MKKCYGFLFVMALLHGCIVNARTISVVIASRSPQKIAAIKESFCEKFPEDVIVYVAYATRSGIPEQPIGFDIALQGVRNRIDSLPEDIGSVDYIVAIESYIEQSAVTQCWYDKGLVLVKTSSQETILTTIATYIPDEYVQLAQQLSCEVLKSGYSMTVGSAIQQSFVDKIINPLDWHREVEFGGVSRQQILKDALFKVLHADELNFIKNLVVSYPDFPKPGIIFANFLPILNNPQAFAMTIDLLVQRYKALNLNAVIGLESRGFILGAALAYELGVSFVPFRKPGKLPGPIYSVNYQKEYGFDTLVVSQDSLQPGQRVIIIDDLIATGGSARAAIELVHLTGAQPIEFVSLLKVAALEEQAYLSIPRFNLID
ncbi:adenine phosphoribosyltransferase [Candidatus Babeliales bacterium]|nr:adenine phosphoribosyltransferase [Candidatus Babeliales bacterium]MBP9844373.1 adenine phosphoribosyltransferase [Candidatus Babeliales bacterium]